MGQISNLDEEEVDRFLAAKGVKCPCCGGRLEGILINSVPANALLARGNTRQYEVATSMIHIGEDQWSEGPRPGFYVVPTICDTCGSVQQFSLGAIQGFLKVKTDE